MSEYARSFRLHLTDGRIWQGAQFADGFVCVHHPEEINICTIAVSMDALFEDRHPEHPLSGARVEWPEESP